MCSILTQYPIIFYFALILDDLIAAGESGSYDLAFLDCDKENFAQY